MPSVGTYYDVNIKNRDIKTEKIIQSEYTTIPHSFPRYARKNMPIIGIGKKSPKDIGNIQGFTMLPPLSAVRYCCDLENINELKMYIHIPRIKYKKPNKK